MEQYKKISENKTILNLPEYEEYFIDDIANIHKLNKSDYYTPEDGNIESQHIPRDYEEFNYFEHINKNIYLCVTCFQLNYTNSSHDRYQNWRQQKQIYSQECFENFIKNKWKCIICNKQIT